MKPGKLDLPTVWRGRTYPQIILTWLDQDGQPIDLTGWTPHATSKQIDFNPTVLDAVNGVTTIGPLAKTQTAGLKLGVENWDWIWDNNGDGTPPLLAGSVQIKESVTQGSGNVGPPGIQPPQLVPPSRHGARFPLPVVILVTDPNQAAFSIYTTDGTDPTFTNGTRGRRRDLIVITQETTVKAIAAVDENNVSQVVSGFYTDQP